MVKPCCSVTHPRTKKNPGPLNLKMGQGVPKTLKTSPSAHFFFDDRAADGRKHCAKMRGLEISKNTNFYDVSFSLGMKHIVVKPFLKQHAFLVDPQKMEGPNQEKGSKFGSCIEISNTNTSQRGPFRPKKAPKKVPFRVFGDEKGPVLAAHPVLLGWEKPHAKTEIWSYDME